MTSERMMGRRRGVAAIKSYIGSCELRRGIASWIEVTYDVVRETELQRRREEGPVRLHPLKPFARHWAGFLQSQEFGGYSV